MHACPSWLSFRSTPLAALRRESHITDVEKKRLERKVKQMKHVKATSEHTKQCSRSAFICIVFRANYAISRVDYSLAHIISKTYYLFVVLTPSFPRNCIDAFDADPYLFCWKSFVFVVLGITIFFLLFFCTHATRESLDLIGSSFDSLELTNCPVECNDGV